jgi:Na+-transporting NADH:ubiquinone oxidoreductase subunit NqrE
MSFKLQSTSLLLFSFLFAAILGVHDEFLQGFHSSRTFGLRDMVVNSMGAGGGALIWHGLGLFSGNLQGPDNNETTRPAEIIYLGWLTLSTICFIWPCSFYTGGSGLPFWPAIMLVAGTFFYSVYADSFPPSIRHGITMVSFGTFALIFYSPLSNVTNTIFF